MLAKIKISKTILGITLQWRGAAWSSGQHRRLPFQGSRDRIPVFLFLLFVNVNVPRANSSEEMRVRKEQVVHPREKKGGSGKQRTEEERPAGVSGMATRKAFGSFQKDD